MLDRYQSLSRPPHRQSLAIFNKAAIAAAAVEKECTHIFLAKMNFHQATNINGWKLRAHHKSMETYRILCVYKLQSSVRNNHPTNHHHLELNKTLSEFTLQAINLAALYIWLDRARDGENVFTDNSEPCVNVNMCVGPLISMLLVVQVTIFGRMTMMMMCVRVVDVLFIIETNDMNWLLTATATFNTHTHAKYVAIVLRSIWLMSHTRIRKTNVWIF